MARSVGRIKKREQSFDLNITSVMDTMVIIVCFLLSSQSADGSMLTNAENMTLPNSVANVRPKEVSVQLAVTHEMILVDNKSVVDTKTISNMDQDKFDTDTTSALDKALQKHMRAEKEMVKKGLLNNVEGQIIVQIDKSVNFDLMYKMMRVCGRNGYNNMKFAVMMRDQ